LPRGWQLQAAGIEPKYTTVWVSLELGDSSSRDPHIKSKVFSGFTNGTGIVHTPEKMHHLEEARREGRSTDQLKTSYILARIFEIT
jgi:hypothetical protein